MTLEEGSIAGFDASTAPEDTFAEVTIGRHTAAIVDVQKKRTNAGDGAYLNLRVQILDGPCKGRSVFDMLNLWNSSEKAVKIAEARLASILKAIGVITPRCNEDLLNKPLLVDVVHELWNGAPQAKVKRYSSRDEALPLTSISGGGTPAWMAGGNAHAQAQPNEPAPSDGDPPF